jgi:DNA-binding SARP family transcriptional activator
MQFRLLGPVEIESDDGTVHTLARRHERGVLAILLLNPGAGDTGRPAGRAVVGRRSAG